MTPFSNPNIKAYFDAAPPKDAMLMIRATLFALASDMPETQGLSETFKWGQPSYAPVSGSGTPLRIGQPKDGGFGLYVHCQTTVMSDFAALSPDAVFDGNRGILFRTATDLNVSVLTPLIRSAFLYHQKG